MIDASTLERIIDTANVIDVVQDYVTLKRRGANYLGLCPFHNEKTPSFTVSPAKNIYKCFGCGKGGNPVNFIMEHDHLSYYEALKFLARKYGIDFIEKEQTEEDIAQKNIRESLEIVTGYGQKYFSETLFNHTDGKAIGLSYFKERGFSDKTIQTFQLGYCTDKRDDFTQSAIKAGYKLEFLVKTGLTVQHNDRYFDRFSGRVIFPIHALSGKPIAFGARTLRTDKETAKYLNSPESEIYYKSKIVYGIYHAKKAISDKGKCFLVEGYIDVISMFQAGIENVVASSGTSLTVEQVRLIKRFTDNITIIYDGDKAGINAALRGIDIIIEEGLNVKVLLLPEGEDPDSFSRKVSSSELIDYVAKNETDFIQFKTKILLKDVNNDPAKKAAVISDIVKSIALIPNNLTRSLYLKECSNLLEVDESVLYYELNNHLIKNADQKRNKRTELPIQQTITQKQPPVLSNKQFDIVEKEIVRLLLTYGDKELFYTENDVSQSVAYYIINEIKNDDIVFSNQLYQKVFELITSFYNDGNPIEHKTFIHNENPEICKLTIDLLTPIYDLSKIWEKHDSFVTSEDLMLKEVVPKTIISYKYARIKKELSEIEKQLKAKLDDSQIQELIQRHTILKQILIKISMLIGNRTI
ncbi:MAG: DNA primase [Bacteroidetes bacterium GWA2_30_7]|nr:MAG: DNA primase [Bacteroidetes bacterium GWA2_30_7]